MGALNAPAWLVPAFVRSAVALGATASREELEAEAESLLDMWSTPDRHHHGVTHLVTVLERVDELGQETHNPDLVRLAGWYHGVVFDADMVRNHKRVAGENKPASAALAERHLLALGVRAPSASRVRDIILDLTRHDPDPADVDACALCDADLSILACEPQRYKAYRERVRQEFDHIPVRDYVEARISIITKLLAREHLFTSPLAQQWEEAARQNLEAELARLRAELATLPERAEGDDAIEERPLLRPLRPSGGADVELSAPEARPRAERFVKDPTTGGLPAVPDRASTGTLPAVPAVEASEADDEPAECIGIPFEEREEARRVEEPTEVLSAMEYDPLDPANLPERRETEELPRLVESEDTDADAGDAPSRTVDRVSIRERFDVSTDLDDDAASTGTLFRPVEP